ncbi:MAG TPA: DUF2809 domain-containing protein [Flavobacterium sp.]|nr:DUF2809 domain-containing protein [Flavobacterium sp.]
MTRFLTFHRGYFAASVALFLIEVSIALFVHDHFIRPYFGDTLVVILLYCTVRTVFKVRMLPTALGVLLFAFWIEFLQYCNFIYWLGWEHSTLARTVIGHSAAWEDVWAYVGGFLLIVLVESLRGRSLRK